MEKGKAVMASATCVTYSNGTMVLTITVDPNMPADGQKVNPIELACDQLLQWMLIGYATDHKNGVSEEMVRRRLLTMIPLGYVDGAIEMLVASERVMVLKGEKPDRWLVPKAR